MSVGAWLEESAITYARCDNQMPAPLGIYYLLRRQEREACNRDVTEEGSAVLYLMRSSLKIAYIIYNNISQTNEKRIFGKDN